MAKSRNLMVGNRCPFCGKMNKVAVNDEDFRSWQGGMLVQKAFPYLSADEREILVSGICGNCFPSDPEEDEEEDADACERESLAYTGQWW